MRDYFKPPARVARQQVVIQAVDGSEDCQWVCLVPEEPARRSRGTLEQLARDYAESVNTEFILLLSPDDVTLRGVELSEAERKHYRQLVPYTLEDDLAENIELLQFAYSAVRDNKVGVATVRKSTLEEIVERFAAQGVFLDVITPEVLLLPWSEQELTCLQRGEHVILRTGLFSGAMALTADFPAVLDMVQASSEEDSYTVVLIREAVAPALEAEFEHALEKAR